MKNPFVTIREIRVAISDLKFGNACGKQPYEIEWTRG